jgi:MoaA/NifB/PqqE/SkfB family radical SAM enzyme
MILDFFNRKKLKRPLLLPSIVKKYNMTRPTSSRKHLCYLPYTQLYISFEGNIYVCCGNRKFLLGKYPEQSLHDIWFGERVQKLQRHIKNNDLNRGCGMCREQLLNGNFELVLARGYDKYAPYESAYPVSFEFELSNQCNLDCIMCTPEFSSTVSRRYGIIPDEKTFVFDDKFLQELNEFLPHLKFVSFKGGEPFLIKFYLEIWQKIIDINPAIQINLISNITAYNEKIKMLLDRSNFYLNISIDSFIKERYETIRKNAVFEKTTANLKELLELNRTKGYNHITLMVCFMTINWDEMPEFIRFCNENNIAILFLYITWPAPHLSLKYSGPKTQQYVYDTLNRADIPSNTPNERHNKETYIQLLKQIKTWTEEANSSNTSILLSHYKDSLESYLENKVLCGLPEPEKQTLKTRYKKQFSDFIKYGTYTDNTFNHKLIEMPQEKLTDLLLSGAENKQIFEGVTDNYNKLLL